MVSAELPPGRESVALILRDHEGAARDLFAAITSGNCGNFIVAKMPQYVNKIATERFFCLP
jgi:hypothetical protein